jgi:hypothetical protein
LTVLQTIESFGASFLFQPETGKFRIRQGL